MWAWLLLAACRSADPDALLHQGDLPGAAAASGLDLDHPVAEVLAFRARRDPTVTVAAIADAVEAVRVLEGAPAVRTQPLDLSFASLEGFGAALDALREGPAILVIGRADGRGDGDPYTDGPLPWRGGRVIGWARADLAALGRSVDADPPPRLVVLAAQDDTGSVYLNVERRGDAWWVLAVSDPHLAARLVLAAESVRDYGAAALRERQGGGIVRR
jgi:hypothetical protein